MVRKPKNLNKIIVIALIAAQIIGISSLVAYSQPYLYYQTVLGPYLSWSNDGMIQNNLSSTTMTISWRSEEMEVGHLVYWSDTTDPVTLTNATINIQHSYRLDNLQPDTKYYYKIGNELHESPKLHFTTMAANPSVITFSMWADTQPPGSNFRLTTPLIVDRDPQFVIQSGDLVSQGGNWDHWQEYLSVIKDFTPYRAFMPAPGNHETYGDDPDIENFKEVFALPGNESTYSYCVGQDDMLFIAINTGANGVITANDLDFVQQTLNAHYLDFTWIAIYCHHPPYCSESTNTGLNASFATFVETYDVDVVFTGHVHIYERFVVPNNVTGNTNITFYVAGGGGGSLSGDREVLDAYSEMHFNEHHVLHARVTDSEFYIETQDISTEIRDTHTMTPKDRSGLVIP